MGRRKNEQITVTVTSARHTHAGKPVRVGSPIQTSRAAADLMVAAGAGYIGTTPPEGDAGTDTGTGVVPPSDGGQSSGEDGDGGGDDEPASITGRGDPSGSVEGGINPGGNDAGGPDLDVQRNPDQASDTKVGPPQRPVTGQQPGDEAERGQPTEGAADGGEAEAADDVHALSMP
jgi:hypothetical protein